MDCSPKLAMLTATLRQYGGFENELLSLILIQTGTMFMLLRMAVSNFD